MSVRINDLKKGDKITGPSGVVYTVKSVFKDPNDRFWCLATSDYPDMFELQEYKSLPCFVGIQVMFPFDETALEWFNRYEETGTVGSEKTNA